MGCKKRLDFHTDRYFLHHYSCKIPSRFADTNLYITKTYQIIFVTSAKTNLLT